MKGMGEEVALFFSLKTFVNL